MPLTDKGEKIKAAMRKQYGAKKGEKVFYASENKGTIKGVHRDVDYVRARQRSKKKRQGDDPEPL